MMQFPETLASQLMQVLALVFAFRFPVLFSVAIALIGLKAPRSSMFRGIFEVDGRRLGIAFLSILLATSSVVLSGWIVVRYGPQRLMIPEFRGLSRNEPEAFLPLLTLLAAVLAGPAIIAVWRASRAPDRAKGLHLTLALATLLVVGWGAYRFSEAVSGSMPVEDWKHGAGYALGGKLAFEHVFAHFWALLVLVLYALPGFFRYRRLRRRDSSGIPTPALASLFFLLTWLSLGLSGLAFYLDHWGVPVLTVTVALLWLLARIVRSDHLFETTPLQQLPPVLPQAALESGPGDSIVIVTASGGGILLAAWTAKVLGELDRLERFRQQVRLVSSVSGGSVGALYWLQAVWEGDPRTAERILAAAQRSSLDNIAWGLVYPDFLRLLFPPLSPRIDRGWAMEETWKLGWNFPDRLSDWRPAVLEGRMPGVIFNVTAAETGEKIMVSTVDLEKRPKDLSVRRTFYEIHKDLDLSPVTAARLSATFPFVSPAARSGTGEPVHFVDGGYFDNYGSSSVAQWLRDAVPKGGGKIKRILVLAITGYRRTEVGEEQREGRRRRGHGWTYQLLAPIQTLFSTRSTSQRSRRHVELKLLQEAMLNRGVEVEIVTFDYPFPDEPLSWHLTSKEAAALAGAWEERRPQARVVEAYLAGASP